MGDAEGIILVLVHPRYGLLDTGSITRTLFPFSVDEDRNDAPETIRDYFR